MEVLDLGQHRFTRVFVVDGKGDGNAHHIYQVFPANVDPNDMGLPFVEVKFQKGPVKENGVNGCHQEDLLNIVQHRLECFQEGDFACIENERALSSLRDCIGHLNSRTKDRQKRNVEGTNEK